jgi:RyR domain-containing protein
MNKPSSYRPEPIDTSRVEVSSDILELTERLARHAHDLWAQERMAEGWRYGRRRDDAHKKHPCLVPYERLPESEKDYDRRMALGTLRAILALGYRIERKVRR